MTPMEVEATTEPRATQEHSKKCGVGGGSASEGFDCNICLDFAVDPVVTLCGHLYCWPCIYRWLRVDDGPNTQQCPVCKSPLSEKSLVPLYGRGRSTKRASQNAIGIPRRPSVPPDQISSLSAPQSPTTLDEDHRHHHYTDLHPPAYRHHRHQHYHLPYDYVPSSPSSSPMGSSSVIHSTAGGVLGGMAIAVLPWVSRNQEEAAGMYYGGSSPYYVAAAGGGSPRLRRQEREVERSLNQIWVFLFCCALLCLLLF